MIETPVKAPPPGGPPSAPPPDARTRVTDPPPDPGARHHHACVECGLPLHDDQAACLACGTMVDQGSGYAGIRRAALGSATALLVLGSAVGAAVAGLPHGKHVGKAPVAQALAPKKPIPPATADAGSAPNSGGATDLPGAGTGSKPPPIAPETPHGSDSSGIPSSAAPGGSGGGTPSGGSGGSDAKTNGDTDGKTGDKKDHRDRDTGSGKPAGPSLFSRGEAPENAWVFTSSGQSDGGGATIDSNPKSAWTTSRRETGIEIDPGPDGFRQIGVVTTTPGWSLEVYFSTSIDPSGYPSPDWQSVGSTNATGKDVLDLDGAARTAKHYLVWVAHTGGKRVRINEIQLMN
jgi:hypothetical protein